MVVITERRSRFRRAWDSKKSDVEGSDTRARILRSGLKVDDHFVTEMLRHVKQNLIDVVERVASPIHLGNHILIPTLHALEVNMRRAVPTHFGWINPRHNSLKPICTA